MKSLAEININLSQTTEQINNHELQGEVTQQVVSLVDQVFDQLSSIFPAWKHAWGSNQEKETAKKEWLKALYENDIRTVDQIQNGLKNARSKETDFLPSTGNFISWCKPSPEDFGYPSVEKALRLCITCNSKSKLNLPLDTIRPIIIELVARIDWHRVNFGSTARSREKSDKYFLETYMELIGSGYRESIETNSPRLETQEITKPRMSEKQKFSRSERGQSVLDSTRKKLKKVRVHIQTCKFKQHRLIENK